VKETSRIDALRRENDELRAAAARQAERARRAARLRGITARLASSLDRDDIFEEIVRASDDLFDPSGVALLLTDEQAGALQVETGWRLAHTAGADLPIATTIAARALEARHAVAIEDTTAMDAVFPPPALGKRPGALLIAPIRVEGRPYGMIEVYYDLPRAIPSEDVDLLDALSDSAAIALRNATAYTRILEQGAELARRNEEQARQREELGRLNDELRRANVLKSQFLSTISHELRTPLTSIIGFSSILLRGRSGEVLSGRQRDNAERILISARHLVTLINDILDLSRIEAGRLDVFRREVDLHELLERVRVEMDGQARAKGLSLTVEPPRGDADARRVVTDADRLRQVLLNLVSNAIKFTERGGVTLRAARSRDTVAVAVEDTGVGIALEEQERVFDEFYQADQSNTRTAGGTGLGLTISRRLVTLLDGQLTLRSTPGVGSAFTIVLPVSPAAQSVASPAQRGARPLTAKADQDDGATVLVIDDDPEMVLLLERALEGSHYRVVGALSADDGLHRARETRPDAILLDVMMPETDGWRALHRLKSDPRTARIPVVMHTIVADQALGFSLGATDYLVKPVEREHLLTVLDRLTPVAMGPILVVDDDEGIRTLLARILAEENVPVVLAANGEDALRLAAEQAPRLVLLDLMMPGLDGFEVLRRLRRHEPTRHLPVVVLTAKALTREEEQVLHREASMVVTKNGVPLDRLLDEVRGAIGLPW